MSTRQRATMIPRWSSTRGSRTAWSISWPCNPVVGTQMIISCSGGRRTSCGTLTVTCLISNGRLTTSQGTHLSCTSRPRLELTVMSWASSISHPIRKLSVIGATYTCHENSKLWILIFKCAMPSDIRWFFLSATTNLEGDGCSLGLSFAGKLWYSVLLRTETSAPESMVACIWCPHTNRGTFMVTALMLTLFTTISGILLGRMTVCLLRTAYSLAVKGREECPWSFTALSPAASRIMALDSSPEYRRVHTAPAQELSWVVPLQLISSLGNVPQMVWQKQLSPSAAEPRGAPLGSPGTDICVASILWDEKSLVIFCCLAWSWQTCGTNSWPVEPVTTSLNGQLACHHFLDLLQTSVLLL